MLLNNLLNGKKVILASQSPRRQHLLGELGIPFEVQLKGDSDESYPKHLTFSEIPIYLAQKKAKPFLGSLQSNEILITSDTIVWCNGNVLGKPNNSDEAVAILQEISGKKHTVVTGVSLVMNNREHSFSSSTDVFFKPLNNEEIIYYVEKFKPYDKAGAYGIQEWIGYIGVERIEGSYFNVMGLPVQKLYEELMKFLST